MSAEWTGEVSELAKPPKKRVPVWIWACGGGCLLAFVVALLLAALSFNFFKKAMDQDAQWERLGQYLPVETRPPGIQIVGIPFKLEGMSMWILTDHGRKLQATVLSAEPGADAAKTRDELFDATKEISFMGLGRHDPELGEIEVQGRRLKTLRYTSRSSESEAGPLESFLKEMQGASVAVDLAPEGSEALLALILTRQGTNERIEDAQVAEFLAPFRIPGSNLPPPPEPPAQPTPPDEGR